MIYIHEIMTSFIGYYGMADRASHTNIMSRRCDDRPMSMLIEYSAVVYRVLSHSDEM